VGPPHLRTGVLPVERRRNACSASPLPETPEEGPTIMNDPVLASLPSWAELLQRYEQPGEPEYEIDTSRASSGTHEPRFSTLPGEASEHDDR